MDRALDETREVGRNTAAAEQLYEELMKHPPKRRLTLVRNSRRFQTPELCQLLIDKGFDQRFTDVTRRNGTRPTGHKGNIYTWLNGLCLSTGY